MLLISALTAFIFNSELVVIVPGVSYTLVAYNDFISLLELHCPKENNAVVALI